MDRFKPSRASPPASRLNKLLQESAADVSSSLESLAGELTELTPDDISLIDSVIKRAGPSATTFLTIFKAYSEVLAEKGLADANETVCYGKLLKLGTLKGRTWAEKWDKVKSHAPQPATRARSALKPIQQVPSPETRASSVSDIFGPESTLNYAESTPRQPRSYKSNWSALPPPPRSSLAPPRLPRPPPSVISNRSSLAPSTIANLRVQHASSSRPTSIARQTSEPTRPTPTHRMSFPRQTTVSQSEHQAAGPSRPPFKPASKPPPPPVPRVVKINEEDAWKKIEMERHQENAELFYQDKLLERFWTMWKEGYQWITTTSDQVAEARDHLLLEKHLQQWRAKAVKQRELVNRADQFVAFVFFKRWLATLEAIRQRKRRHQIREEMRENMRVIRDKWQARVLRGAWVRWRRANQLVELSDRCSQLMARRFYLAWRNKWIKIGDTSARADQAFQQHQLKALVGAWRQWKRTTGLRSIEATMRNRVELRIMDNAMTGWRRHLQNQNLAIQIHDRIVQKAAILRWREAMGRIESMEGRADRQLAKSDAVFMYALMKLWKDKKNANTYERKRTLRVGLHAWDTWKAEFRRHEDNYALAVRFSERPGNAVVKTALCQWKASYSEIQSVIQMADALYNNHVASRVVLQWRKGLRKKLKMIKMAKAANAYFLLRTTYVKWRARWDHQQLEKLLQQHLSCQQEKKFQTWLLKTRVKVSRETAIKNLMARRDQATMHKVLSHWVQRTVDIKEREFLISQQTKMVSLISTLDKWKKLYKRRAEQKSLLENYMLVRQEETRRRLFGRWVTLIRLARSRRQVLQEAEDEIQLRTLEKFWEVWRERRLKDREDEFLLRWNGGVVRNAFTKWYSKTKAPPAIQFRAIRLKHRAVEQWKAAMVKAKQFNDACKFHRERTTESFFTQWVEAFKVKKMRKAVARARHLRLPAAAPKNLQPPVARLYPRRNSFLEAPLRPPAEDDEDIPDAVSHAPSALSSTYIGNPSTRLSTKTFSESPQPRFSRLVRDKEQIPFGSGERSSLSRLNVAGSEAGVTAPSARRPPKAPSSVASTTDAPLTRRVWPDLSRRSKLFLAPR